MQTKKQGNFMGNEEGRRKTFYLEMSLVITSGNEQNFVTIDDVAT